MKYLLAILLLPALAAANPKYDTVLYLEFVEDMIGLCYNRHGLLGIEQPDQESMRVTCGNGQAFTYSKQSKRWEYDAKRTTLREGLEHVF